tara:strand:+ start:199 stop:1158 length:960 start_codon:yes stop_codon:yes gene_type:complete
MSQVKLVSIERVISGVYRDLQPIIDLNENDLIEWAGEALEFIGAYSQMVEKVEYILVQDHRALIPCGLQKIVQIAYKFTEGAPTEMNMLKTCDPPIVCPDTCADCSGAGCPDLCQTSAQLIENAELFLQYYVPNNFVTSQRYYTANFRPLRLATSNFALSATAHCTGCVNLSANCSEEYSIDWPYLRTSFKQGHICIAYIGQALDDRGFPLIPDQISYVEAVRKYIIYKLKYSEFIQGGIPANTFAKIEDDWQWYCAQARGKANMPDTIDKLQNILDQRDRLIPKTRNYFGFFGNLSTPESLNFGTRIHRNFPTSNGYR